MSDSQFITQLYLNLGNSVPDAQGLSFWLGQLSGRTGDHQVARAQIASEVSFVLQTFDPTAASFLALTPEQQHAALDRAATYQNKIAVSEALAATNNTAFNTTTVGDAAYQGEVRILQGINQTDASRNTALQQINAANAASNPALLLGQGLTLFLTTGLDVPPAFQTAQDNAIFSSSDVILSGQVAQTLNPGDHLVSTGKNATLDLSASTQSTALHDYAGFQTDGIPNLHIHNSDIFGAVLNGSGMHGLTTIQSSDAVAGGFVTLNNIPNLVALNLDGSADAVTLNYQNPVTGTQNLGLTNVQQTPGTGIKFGTNAPSSIAVHLTGDNTIGGITDTALTTLKVDSTDTGHTSNLGLIATGGVNKLLTADFSGVDGKLTVAFANNSFANGATVTLGTNDTIKIGESNNTGHHRDVVNVNGQPGGLYNITLGNQDDHVNLGAHNVADTLTFMHPWAGNTGVGPVTTAPPIPGPAPAPDIGDIITGANVNLDQFNFSVSGFNPFSGANPAATVFSHLLHAGTSTSTAGFVAAGDPTIPYIYVTGGVGAPMVAGENLIIDLRGGDNTAAAVQTSLRNTGVSDITYSTSGALSPGGAFLLAYQAADGIHVAEAQVLPQAIVPVTTGGSALFAGTVVHDIIDIVGQTLTPAFASHVSFVV